MNFLIEKQMKQEVKELILKSGFPVTQMELELLDVNDFGLGDLRKEGFAFIDILRTARIRITILVLLPNQTLPQHIHPPYEDERGKEETIRVLYGQTRVYVAGEQNNDKILIPAGKEKYYTALHEIILKPGEQFTVEPNSEHWFQGGNKGAVNIAFQNRVIESNNLFFDPASANCVIIPDEK